MWTKRKKGMLYSTIENYTSNTLATEDIYFFFLEIGIKVVEYNNTISLNVEVVLYDALKLFMLLERIESVYEAFIE